MCAAQFFAGLENLYFTHASDLPARSKAIQGALRGLASSPEDSEQFLQGLLEINDYSFRQQGSAHRHHNGFDKLTLYRSPDFRFTVRLHIWWPGEKRLQGTVHDHRWDFTSLVLRGKLQVVNFHVFDEDPGSPSIPKYGARLSDAGEDGSKGVLDLGLKYLRPQAWYVLEQGSVHGLAHDVPHQAFPDDSDLCATLVIVDPAARDHSNSYRDEPNPGRKTGKLHLFSDEEVRLCISRFLRMPAGG